MSRHSSSSSPFPSTPGSVEPDSPIDSVVARLIRKATGDGRGFALSVDRYVRPTTALVAAAGLAASASGATTDGEPAEPAPGDADRHCASIAVLEQPPTPDEYVPFSAARRHVVEDAASFLAFCKKHGKPETSMVFYDNDRATLVVDDSIGRGIRETCTLDWAKAPEWEAWGAILAAGKTLSHKELLKFVLRWADTLDDPSIVDSLRVVRSTATVKLDSDLRQDANSVGVVMTSAAGDEVKSFPKAFIVDCPVLESNRGKTARFEIHLEVIMPETANQAITFLLTSPEYRSEGRRVVNDAFSEVRAGLTDWTICRGRASYVPRSVGVEAESPAN